MNAGLPGINLNEIMVLKEVLFREKASASYRRL
jgi:hypothetical protein